MKTLEEHIREHYKLRVEDEKFVIYVADKREEAFDNMLEAQDVMEDQAEQDLKDEYKIFCSFCNLFCGQEEVEYRLADWRYTAPYGETMAVAGHMGTVPVCPICGDDMEAC